VTTDFRHAIRGALVDDPMVLAVVGLDRFGNMKVYEGKGLKDEDPPYIVWQMIPGEVPQGTYGDVDSIQEKNFQVTAWGRDNEEAWQLWYIIEQALKDTEFVTDPWNVIFLRKMGDEASLPDQGTNWFQVPGTWRASLVR